MITISDPYVFDYTPPDDLRDFAEEKRMTRECMRVSAALPDRVRVVDDVLEIPSGISEELKDKMVRYEGYLRWTAGLPATHWLPGGLANFPEGVDPTQRTGVKGLAAERSAA